MNTIKKAGWIRSDKDMGDVCPIFIKDFECRCNVKKATLFITAMGVYEAFINGERVGDFILAPGWTSYQERHQYQEYDVTKMLKESNSIHVTVARGWYSGDLREERYRNVWGAFTALIACIDIEYEDGTKEYILTDTSWSVAESNIRFSEIYDGEIYDAAFSCDELFEVKYLLASKAPLIPQEGEYIVEQEILKPIELIRTPRGETVIDFGQNLTGYVRFTVNADKGDRICYSHAEVLDSDGNFYTDNLRTAKAKIEYICRDGVQSYKPHHTFMGFRYIRIDEAPKSFTMESVEAVVVHSKMKRTGYFACSNEKINKLFSNIIWGQKGNFLDIPTDCPQRDERLGWTGDAQVFVKTASFNFDIQKFFKKWLRDLAVDQRADGGVPVVVPNVWADRPPSAAWGDAAVICPWQIYLTYNDKEVLKEQLDSMTRWVEYMHSRGPEEFLWLGDNRHYSDWLGMDSDSGSYRGASDMHFIASAYYAYSTGILVKTLKALGKDARKYEELYKNIVTAFQNYFPECKTQTECALALYFELCKDRAATAKKLCELIEKFGNKLATGFVGTPYLLEALSSNGYHEKAYELLLEEGYPSWLFSVNMGATTIWEHWDGIRADGTMWSVKMNSFNHYAYGAVAAWMYETIAGIRIDEDKPGFENVILCPKTTEKLDWAEASIDTAYGIVRSKWYRENGRTVYEFDVPNTATLKLPGEAEKILAKGSYRFEK